MRDSSAVYRCTVVGIYYYNDTISYHYYNDTISYDYYNDDLLANINKILKHF